LDRRLVLEDAGQRGSHELRQREEVGAAQGPAEVGAQAGDEVLVEARAFQSAQAIDGVAAAIATRGLVGFEGHHALGRDQALEHSALGIHHGLDCHVVDEARRLQLASRRYPATLAYVDDLAEGVERIVFAAP
jgi:hypothetical protein